MNEDGMVNIMAAILAAGAIASREQISSLKSVTIFRHIKEELIKRKVLPSDLQIITKIFWLKFKCYAK
jgi:hypothetical protein